MALDALLLSRSQCAFMVAFHLTFPSFAIGLAGFLAVLQGLWLTSKNPIFETLYRFWLKVFVVSLGMGLLSGVALLSVHGWREALSPTSERLAHMILAAFLTTALLVAGASAWRLLKDRTDQASIMALRMAVGMAAIIAPIHLMSGRQVTEVTTTACAFQVMAGLGVAIVALGAWGGWLAWRRIGPETSRAFLMACVVMSPVGLASMVAGWMVAEADRQPALIHGALGASLAAVHAVAFAASAFFILRLLARGPTPPQPVS